MRSLIFFKLLTKGGKMKNRLKITAILLGTLIFLYGCFAELLLLGVGAGLGTASYMYVDGLLAIEYPLEYDKAWAAANKALENFQISISDSVNEKGVGKIDAVRKDGKRVVVKLRQKGDAITTIAIRIGTFGDQLEAQKLHYEITSIAGI